MSQEEWQKFYTIMESNDFNSFGIDIQETLELKPLKKEYDELDEENEAINTISIPKKLYKELEELCKINNLVTNNKIIKILENAVFSAEIDYEQGSKHVFNF